MSADEEPVTQEEFDDLVQENLNGGYFQEEAVEEALSTLEGQGFSTTHLYKCRTRDDTWHKEKLQAWLKTIKHVGSDAAGVRNPMDARFALEGVKTACSGGGDKEEAAAMARALVVSQGGLDSMAALLSLRPPEEEEEEEEEEEDDDDDEDEEATVEDVWADALEVLEVVLSGRHGDLRQLSDKSIGYLQQLMDEQVTDRLLFKAGMRVLRALWKEGYPYRDQMRASWKGCGGGALLERAVGLHQRVPAMAEEVQSVLDLLG